MTYTGRFAPSPTGRLHLGSLVGALASYLDARAHNGHWLLRMEDLDPPREVPGAAQAILDSLQAHGLHWDGEVMWQSQRHADYQRVLDRLCARGEAFFCTCSRTELAAQQGIHAGNCRADGSEPGADFAVRCQVADTVVGFDDAIQGHYQQNLLTDVGDFVLKRKDGLFAYQLAVVVDDAEQGITHVVRGSDLLDSTPRQIWLQSLLGAPQPHYAHVPVVINAEGQKLSKQTHARELDSADAEQNLRSALAFLQQPAPAPGLAVPALVASAVQHWDLQRIPRCLQSPYNEPSAET